MKSSQQRQVGGNGQRRRWSICWAACALYAATVAAAEPSVPATVAAMVANGGGTEPVLQRLQQETAAAPAAVTLLQVYQRALQRNPQWQAQQAYGGAARAGVDLARGAFDTRFALRAGHTKSRYFERVEKITRPREQPLPYDAGFDGTLDKNETGGAVNAQDEQQLNQQRLTCVIIDDIIVNPDQCKRDVVISSEPEYASYHSEHAPVSNVFSLQAVQALPWGGSLSAQLQSTRRIKSGYFTLNRLEQVNGSHGDPIGNGSTYPWTSAFSFSFSTPLPYARNAGFNAFSLQVNREVASLDADIGEQQVQQQGDATLARADAAYWELVAGQFSYVVASRHQAAADELAQRGRRLFTAGNVTAYDMAQMDAELERARITAEIAWQRYLSASRALAELLDLDQATALYSDLDAQALLVSELPREPGAQNNPDKHPAVTAATRELEKSRLLNRFYASQLRPDVSLVFNLNYSQSDLVFGYKTWNDSYEHVFEPDRRERYIGLSYRYAFGQRAEKAAWSSSSSAIQQADLQLAQARTRVSHDLNAAQSERASVDARLQQRRIGLEMAQAAYERSGRLREQNQLSEFERLRSLQNLYQAAREYLQAAADYRHDHASVLAAAGGLYRWYQARGAKDKP